MPGPYARPPVSALSALWVRRGRKRWARSFTRQFLPSLHDRRVLKSCRTNASISQLSSFCLSSTSRSPTSSTKSKSLLIMPRPGEKLKCMLDLLSCKAQIQQSESCIRIDFPSREGLSAIDHIRGRRLRSLVALAHHLEEQDQYLATQSPSHTISSVAPVSQ